MASMMDEEKNKSLLSRGVEIQLAHLGKSYGSQRVLHELNVMIPAGEFVSLLGPSGCGKSTLLRLMAGLESPSSGVLGFEGDLIQPGQRHQRHPLHRELSYVFQEAHLLPWRTLLANVALPMELQGVDRKNRREKAMQMLEAVGLADAARRYPRQLSGGMKMRGSLARAMVLEPRLMLLDEPFAALDEIHRARLDELLYRLWEENRMTVVFVTHSVEEAAYLSQRVIHLAEGATGIHAETQVVVDHHAEVPVREQEAFHHVMDELRSRLHASMGVATR